MDDRQPNLGLPFRHRCRNLVTTTFNNYPITTISTPLLRQRATTACPRSVHNRRTTTSKPANRGLDRPHSCMDDTERLTLMSVHLILGWSTIGSCVQRPRIRRPLRSLERTR